MYSKLLVPLDGSKTAEAVLPAARYLADGLKIPVELLAVVDIAELAAHLPADKARMFDAIIEKEAANSGRYVRKIGDTFAGTVKSAVEKGRADEVIAAKGEGGALTAMATHGRSGLGRVLLGSVAEKVLRSTRNPLLLVRAGEETKTDGAADFKHVIVPLDGSELGERILPSVAELAKALNLEVTLFRAYHVPYESYAGDENISALNYDELMAAMRDEAAAYLEKSAATVKKFGIEKVGCVTKEGLSADEIIDFGKKTPGALIAMASHGRSGVKRMVLGSVSEAVARHASVPVLVLRPA